MQRLRCTTRRRPCGPETTPLSRWARVRDTGLAGVSAPRPVLGASVARVVRAARRMTVGHVNTQRRTGLCHVAGRTPRVSEATALLAGGGSFRALRLHCTAAASAPSGRLCTQGRRHTERSARAREHVPMYTHACEWHHRRHGISHRARTHARTLSTNLANSGAGGVCLLCAQSPSSAQCAVTIPRVHLLLAGRRQPKPQRGRCCCGAGPLSL